MPHRTRHSAKKQDRHITRTRHLWTVAVLFVVISFLTTTLILLQWESIKNALPFFEHTKVEQTEAQIQSPSFLSEEEVVVIPPSNEEKRDAATEEEVILPIEKVLFEYIEVKDSCGVHFEGECVVARSGPGIDFPVVARLRNHVILKVGGQVEHDGMTWYKIVFDEYLPYPERVTSDWFVSSLYADVLLDEGEKTTWEDGSATTSKRIVVDRSTQTLQAYEDDELFMETAISTGLELSPTPRGTFTVFKKIPSRYMQGPLPGFTDQYDLPGVPWNLYFTHEGAVIHGAYWHDSFGSRYSHGCVNLSPADAKRLYEWAVLGTKVVVR